MCRAVVVKTCSFHITMQTVVKTFKWICGNLDKEENSVSTEVHLKSGFSGFNRYLIMMMFQPHLTSQCRNIVESCVNILTCLVSQVEGETLLGRVLR